MDGFNLLACVFFAFVIFLWNSKKYIYGGEAPEAAAKTTWRGSHILCINLEYVWMIHG